jgi:hypothetical protein
MTKQLNQISLLDALFGVHQPPRQTFYTEVNVTSYTCIYVIGYDQLTCSYYHNKTMSDKFIF